MRITIIGGTRFIGHATAARLVLLGHDVTVAHRGQTPTLLTGVRHATLDQTDPGAGEVLLETEPEVILHNIVRETAHVEWLREPMRQLRVPLVMTSSMDVYQSFGCLLGSEDEPDEGSPTGEDAPLRANRFPYRGIAAHGPEEPMWHYDKIPAEQLAVELGRESDVPVIIPRLPMVLGAGDPQRRLARFVHSMKRGKDRERVVMPRAVARWRSSYGFVENVAALLAAATTRCVTDPGFASPEGTVLHAIDDVYSMWDLGEMVASQLGWGGEIVEIDDDAAPEVLSMPGGGIVDLAFTQPITEAKLGDYRVLDPQSGLERAVKWELKQAPQADLEQTHEAEDSVVVRG